MNIKNNRRRQETIRRIESVFLEYLKKQELSQIKVCDICKQANINRSTFYANFTDIYDLADKIRDRLKDEVNRLFDRDFSNHIGIDDFLRLFLHIKENQNLYSFYFKLGYDGTDDLKLFNLYGENYGLDTASLDYHITFFKNGFNAVIRKWLEGGCKETPQQMTQILMHEYGGRF